MSLLAWKTAYACSTGTSHARTGAPCQDAAACIVIQAADGSQILVACISDGAGSASQSEHGAKLVVDAFQSAFAEQAREQPNLAFLDERRARAWLLETQAALRALAEVSCHDIRDYACTLLGAVVGDACAVFLQVGDGAIVVGHGEADEEAHSWVFWPQHGEFANSTYFVTMEEAAACLQFDRYQSSDERSPIQELAVFSDGMERLILDMTTHTVHSPSLRPVLDWLATTQPGEAGQPSAVIRSFLDSANVNRRTDDDKSLVVATRVGVNTPGLEV